MSLSLPALMGIFIYFLIIFLNRVFNIQVTVFLENEWQEVHVSSGRIFTYIKSSLQSIMVPILYPFQGPL